jgi:glycosidase
MAFNFPAPGWIHFTNIYEVNLRQYTPEGTIKAFMRELPRLKEMGVHTLWFMPLTPISKEKRKGTLGSYYACSDYTSINPEFGTKEDFKLLVEKAHGMGFKVIIDWVANHTGWDHVWTKHSPEFYKKDDATGDFKTPEGMEDIIELDFENGEMEREMISAMKYWVTEFDIDGFRCDLAFWVNLDFWNHARIQLDQVKPLFWLGEFDELDNPAYGEVFDASYSWTWMHAAKKFYQDDRDLGTLIKILKRYDDLGDSTLRTWFTSNHDENSWNGTEYEKYGDMALLLAVFSCTWNGIPLIYSGQEIPSLKRLQFFDKDPLEWNQLSLHEFYRSILGLRALHPALQGGYSSTRTYQVKTMEPGKVIAFTRQCDDDEVLVALNFSPDEIIVEIHGQAVTLKAWGYYINEKPTR